MTARNRCKATTGTPHPLHCPHPGIDYREAQPLCGNHLRVYDRRGGAPEYWRWPAYVALEDEPTSNAFLDDTPPPVWVDPAKGFGYPEDSQPLPIVDPSGWAEDDGTTWIDGTGRHLRHLDEDELDEPATGVWWLLLGVVAVLAGVALGFWWGRATADTDSKATLNSMPADHRDRGPIFPANAAHIYGTDAATQFYANLGAPTEVQIQTFEAAVFNAAAQAVGSGVTADSVDLSAPGPAMTADDGSCYGVIPDEIVNRESGGNPRAYNASSGAAGCFQFLPSTWGNYGGYASAADAPVSVQRERAAQLWAGGAGCSHWSACATSGDGSGVVPLPLPSPQPLPVDVPQVVYDQPIVYWWVSW